MKIEEISNNTNDGNAVSTSVKIEISLQEDCNIQEISKETLQNISKELYKTFSVSIYKYEREEKKIVLYMNKEDLFEDLKNDKNALQKKWRDIQENDNYPMLYDYLRKQQELQNRENLKQEEKDGKRRINVRFYHKKVLFAVRKLEKLKKIRDKTKKEKENIQMNEELKNAYAEYIFFRKMKNHYSTLTEYLDDEWEKVKPNKKEDNKMQEIFTKYKEYIKKEEKYKEKVQNMRNEEWKNKKQEIEKNILEKIKSIIQQNSSKSSTPHEQ